MPDTLRLTLTLAAADHVRDALVAELADLGFDAFEDDGATLVAYAPASRWDGPTEEAVAGLAGALDAGPVETEVVADRDWNAQWEASLEPVRAGPFVVAPSWTTVPPEMDGQTVLRIDPKMAFGTGYHETTRIVLRLLSEAVLPGGRVLDVGTGTGVLAIAALRSGARSALGVDVDPWSVTNGHENAALNGVEDRFEVREGSLEVVPETGFDLVVANIIRSILAPMLPDLVARTNAGARVVLSGLLTSEREHVIGAMRELGTALSDEASENEWWGGVFVRDA